MKELIERGLIKNRLRGFLSDRSLRETFLVFTLSRSLVFVILVLASQARITDDMKPAGEGSLPVRHLSISLKNATIGRSLRETLLRGDTYAYVKIATYGYERRPFDVQSAPSQLYAYFPFYPLLLWAFS